MLEGLEVSEINYKSIIFENVAFRIDSEYFKKEYLKEDCLRKKHKNIILGQIAYITDGQHGYHEVDETSDIRHLTAKNFKSWFANDIDADRLARWVDDNNKRSSLEINDVILTTRGTVGYCAIVKEDVLPANIDQDVARIKLVENQVLPHFLLCYLNSKFGKDWTNRNQTGMVQQGLALAKLREMAIPILDIKFQYEIQRFVETIFSVISESKLLYSQAEQLLLEELGLKDWKPSEEKTNIKSFKESFLSTGRLDAEYYQPKYEEMLEHLKQFDIKPLGSIVDIKKSIEPGSEAYQEDGIPFIRVANMSKFGLSDTDIHLDRQEYQTYELKPKKDTILLSKDGSIGIAYKVEEDLDVITSGALLHLNIVDKEYLPDYLTLVLNSIIVKLQSERDAGGSIIQHWKPSEIECVIIPKLPKDIQQKISEKIQESFKLKQQSKHLLEVAKRAVEIAIEQNEDAAIEYINQNEIKFS